MASAEKSETNLFLVFVRPLEQQKIQYMVTGSVASILYGEPRLTHDVDIVAELRGSDLEALQGSFGPDIFYFPPLEVIRVEMARLTRGHFNVIHFDTGYKADFYLAGDDELRRWGFAHKRRVEIDGEGMWVAPPEYVIIRKLQFHKEGESEKHIRDIIAMLRISRESVDIQLIEERVRKMGLQSSWALASGSLC